MKRIGFTTTIPVEIVLASGATPVDLNNIFITAPAPERFIDAAHDAGIPRSVCAWIKGIYGVVANGAADEVIAVTNGDCSNTHALTELFTDLNIPVHTFAFPFGEKDPYGFLHSQIAQLTESLGTTEAAVQDTVRRTDRIRAKLKTLDTLTVEGKVSGEENHLWLVCSTDFNTNPDTFEQELDTFLAEAATRAPMEHRVRIGVLGVPPIFSNLYAFLHANHAHVAFNEVQRQFSIPSNSPDYTQRFIDYTYPYDIFRRIEDIKQQVRDRKLDGLIHYVQSFCYRQIQDITVKKHLDVPVLTVEGDSPGELDARTMIRIESFLEMLNGKKHGNNRH